MPKIDRTAPYPPPITAGATGGGPPGCGMDGGPDPPGTRPGISPARCQPDIPSVQTSVSALTVPRVDEVAKLRLRIGALLLAVGCIKPRSVRHY